MRKRLLGSCLLLPFALLHEPSQAQQSPLQRLELQRLEIPPDKIGFMDLVTIAPSSVVPPFVHPGAQLAYVVEGELILTIDGRPELNLKPGASFEIPAATRYSFENRSPEAAKLIDFVVEANPPAP